MELLGFGDLHIKPQNPAIDYEALRVPSEGDAVVLTGDVVHRVNQEDLEEGRHFFERLDEWGIPILAIPGNHDPLTDFKQMIEGFEAVELCHDRIVNGSDFKAVDAGESLDHYSFVGVGCESFDRKPEIRLVDFESLDPRTAEDRRYAADAAASELEDAVYKHICGDWSKSDLLAELGIGATDQQRFDTQLQDVIDRYNRVDSLLTEAAGPVVFLSHVPPYNTPLDRHHSIGQRDADLEGLHVGSLGQKLALREHRPIAALSGHSHNGEYQVGIGSESRPHLLNLDFRRVVSITVDDASGAFSFEFK